MPPPDHIHLWIWVDPPGALNFGFRTMCHQKIFFTRFQRKTRHLYQLSPNDPLFFMFLKLFNKLLVTSHWKTLTHLCHSKTPQFRIEKSNQRHWIFHKKIGFFDKFDEMLRNFWPFWPWKPLFFYAFHWKTIFVCLVTERPHFWRNLSPKDPYIWGACLVALVHHFHMWVPPGVPPGAVTLYITRDALHFMV